MFDPIHSFVKELSWRGVLVEPIPDMFLKLKQNYKNISGLHFSRTAITQHNGTIRMTRIKPEAVENKILAHGALGISTVMPNRGVIGGMYNRIDKATSEILEQYKTIVTVPSITFLVLLSRFKMRKVDLLVVDAEGADWMIVKQFPLQRFRPKVVYFEYDHLPHRERVECLSHFRSAGYIVRLDEVRHENFLAIRRH